MLRKAKLKKLKPMGNFLPVVLKKMGISERVVEQKAVIFWSQAVGKDIKKQTVANRIEKGILFVSVSSPIWINELTYLKPRIIKKLNELTGSKVVKDIKFYFK